MLVITGVFENDRFIGRRGQYPATCSGYNYNNLQEGLKRTGYGPRQYNKFPIQRRYPVACYGVSSFPTVRFLFRKRRR